MKWKKNKKQMKALTITTLILIGLISGPFLLTDIVTASQPPNEPTNPFPADGKENVSVNPELSVYISDDDGDNLNVTFYDDVSREKIATVYDVKNDTRVSVK